MLQQVDRLIDARCRQYADGAAGAVDEVDVLRHQILHPIAEDGVGVAAAKLHQVLVSAGFNGLLNLGCQFLCQLTGAEFVDVFHADSKSFISANSASVFSASTISTLLRA